MAIPQFTLKDILFAATQCNNELAQTNHQLAAGLGEMAETKKRMVALLKKSAEMLFKNAAKESQALLNEINMEIDPGKVVH